MVQSFQWILLVLFSFSFCKIFANYDTLGWTNEQGTIGDDVGYGVTVSGDGFIYVTGWINGSLNGQPNQGRLCFYYYIMAAYMLISQVVQMSS